MYHHLSQAKIRCDADEKCIGVLDRSCDNSGPFHLCKKGFITSKKYRSSCIYKKKIHQGVYFIFLYFAFNLNRFPNVFTSYTNNYLSNSFGSSLHRHKPNRSSLRVQLDVRFLLVCSP